MGEFRLKLFGKNIVDFERRTSLENPTVSITDESAIAELFGDKDEVKVDHDTALTYSAVWRAVSLLSGHVAMVPKHVYRKDPNGDRIIDEKHPVNRLIYRRPSPLYTSFIWFERYMQFLLLWGNAYAIIHRNTSYEPVDLELVHPKLVKPKVQNGELFYKIKGYEKLFKGIDILHTAGLGDSIEGKDPISLARESIMGGLIYQKTGNTFFEKGYLNDRYFTMPGKVPDKVLQNFQQNIKLQYEGMRNQGKIMVLENGAELKSIGIPPENMQFLESKKHQISEVARWFGLPPHKLADLEKSTNNNIEHQGIEYVTDALMIWTVRIEQEFNVKLFKENEQDTHYVRFNLNSLMRGDLKTRAEYYSKASGGMPWLTADEIRSLEDTNKLGGSASVLQVPLNMISSENIQDND